MVKKKGRGRKKEDIVCGCQKCHCPPSPGLAVSCSEAGDGFARWASGKWPEMEGVSPMTGKGQGLASCCVLPRPFLGTGRPAPVRSLQRSPTVLNTGSFQSPRDGWGTRAQLSSWEFGPEEEMLSRQRCRGRQQLLDKALSCPHHLCPEKSW